MVPSVCLLALLPALALGAPLDVRATTAPPNKVFFSWENKQATAGSTHQYSEVSRVPQYYLQPAQGVSWTPADRFTSVTLEGSGSNTTGTLIQGIGGQSVTWLPTGQYSITNPAREYANYILPSLPLNSPAKQLCIYIYKEPKSVPNAQASRDNFDLKKFTSQLGLGDAIAASCIEIVNGQAPSVSAPSSSRTSSASTARSSSTASSISRTSSQSASKSQSATQTQSASKASLTPSSSARSSASASASKSSSLSKSSPASASASASASVSPSPSASVSGPDPAFETPVSFNGKTFINKGLVGFGAIPGDAVDSRGDTIGGIGSAIALQSFTKNGNSYQGVFAVQPDRGHNTQTTTDFEARRHLVSFTLNPYYSATNLGYEDAKKTFQLQYQSSVFYHEANGTPTTGLDPEAVRDGSLPIASKTYNHISVDAEGLVLNSDGSSWVSDEYGPYIYKLDASGAVLQTITPPQAILPYSKGQLNFTSSSNPDTGRYANQGFEGLTASPDGKTLYALLQSGAAQDRDPSGEGRYTRLFSWNVEGQPRLLNSYVFELPVTNGKGKALAQSEIHYLSPTTFLVLSRDGKGNGNDDVESKHKDILLYSTDGATDIANTDYTTGITPVAPKGVLLSSIKAAQPTEFIDIIKSKQLKRFGLQNGDKFSQNLINGKWESIALASVEDPAYPNDYFLFSFSDNDFITLKGHDVTGDYQDPYAVGAGYTLDNQALVWRVTLA